MDNFYEKRNEADKILISNKSADMKLFGIFQIYKGDIALSYPQLYYAILEWKDSHLKELIKEMSIESDIPYFAREKQPL